MYMFRYDSSAFGGLSRQQLVDALIEQGVPAFVGFLPSTEHRCFATALSAEVRTDGDLLVDYNAVSCPVRKIWAPK